MEAKICKIKKALDESIAQLCDVSWMFSMKPGVYFSRDRILTFPKVISCLLAMEGGTLTTELKLSFAGMFHQFDPAETGLAK